MSKHKWANQSAKAKSLPLSAIKKYRQLPEERRKEIQVKMLKKAAKASTALEYGEEEK